ncbi:Isochorismatase hydrolase [Lophiostoma macrostomum CBS 122681]|uniref:Isochorismatase hydrolase n=1 Tax=Lophiostoma macrostomum CBS 122681 TaxID=1314788 RepID=A0A6A6SLV8_9PLEO|nr:Isochorismatase hydrolase [Lophiostoma macrostomum CBS 122681]
MMPVQIRRTALLLSDVQTQILARFPKETQASYLAHIQTLLTFFRAEISCARQQQTGTGDDLADVPLIIHHTLPFGLNGNAFVRPYNRLASGVRKLEAAGHFSATAADPHYPNYAIPAQLAPAKGWGSRDEILLGKLSPSCFSSSDLLKYLAARGIKHVVLVGLTTMGSILESAKTGADLDFHVVCPRERIIDDDVEVHEFLMNRVLPKFVDVVSIAYVPALGEEER